ncbi:S8 family serine peptidase [Streptomyces sp. NPDC102406]|uniref:S8 family serine peptidase n=1 Tax=Streptomyces sp. NPDC102406 TaxID=3366171 RepID=UPI003823E7D1
MPARRTLCRGHGTSDATAIASASAALIWPAHPTRTNNQVLRVMPNTIGAPVDGPKRTDAIGYGVVRPRIALTNHPGNPGPASQYPLPDFPVKASSKPSSSAAIGAGGGKDHQAAAKSEDNSSSTTPWVAAGVGAVRGRRRCCGRLHGHAAPRTYGRIRTGCPPSVTVRTSTYVWTVQHESARRAPIVLSHTQIQPACSVPVMRV